MSSEKLKYRDKKTEGRRQKSEVRNNISCSLLTTDYSLFKNRKGFTLLELMLTVAIFVVFFGIGSIGLSNFLSDQAVESEGRLLVQYLRQARTNAVAQLEDSSWGIYLNTTPDPDQFTFYNGSSYAARNTNYDILYTLRNGVELSNISLTGGGNEILFSKRSGQTSQSGTIELSNDTTTFDISVNGLGLVNY